MAAVVLTNIAPTPPPSLGSHGPHGAHASQPAATPSTTPAIDIPGAGLDRAAPVQIPNKHMPQPNPGGIKFTSPVTPPASPPDGPQISDVKRCMESLLCQPEGKYACITKSPPIYSIDAAGVADAMNFTSRQPLPDIDQLFPWAHGLHPENAIQLSFFFARKKSARRTPICYRGLCIVKVGRDPTRSKLKGAIMPEEILPLNPQAHGFVNVDPRDGFNVRNFHIQVGKFAVLSDIVVYGDDDTDASEVLRVARRISAAQLHYRALCQGTSSREFPVYSTFVVQDPFSTFEDLFPELIAVDSHGNLTGKVVDFCHWERMEMSSMSKASEIAHNVFLGSTADARYNASKQEYRWGVLIEASDLAQMPLPEMLRDLLESVDQSQDPQFLEFPGSGTISPGNWSRMDADGIIDTCRWIYAIANGKLLEEESRDEDGDRLMSTPTREPRKILIHCTDGYTETSLLALAYVMFAEVVPVHEAWIKLHTEKGRNFFAYDKDLAFLRYIEHTLLDAGARNRDKVLDYGSMVPPEWIYKMDGSLPSRVLSYMYLGNLLHANNCRMLLAMGIKRVLSIGEELSWSDEEINDFGEDKVMIVKDLQDNGCDPLEYQFWRCLDFINDGRVSGEPVLVHCRVGVSRSATICIAEVMRSMNLSLPRAYCYVRARRLNVIIQPHLRFMYELLKFEESLSMRNSRTTQRELEWVHVAREIATMNRPYTRSN